jgi:hypothetical protein
VSRVLQGPQRHQTRHLVHDLNEVRSIAEGPDEDPMRVTLYRGTPRGHSRSSEGFCADAFDEDVDAVSYEREVPT